MNKILTTITFLLFACATCVGQSSYKGLTPGRSTRADAERVLGQPVKSLSKTLVQYESSEEVVKVFVQYRDESPAAVVERIELTCSEVGGGRARHVWTRTQSWAATGSAGGRARIFPHGIHCILRRSPVHSKNRLPESLRR